MEGCRIQKWGERRMTQKYFLQDLWSLLKDDWRILLFLVGIPLILSVPLWCIEHNAINTCIIEWFDALYLTWMTITTVGYGDIHPVTGLGRFIVSVDAAFGIILFGVIVSHFAKARQ